VLVAILRPQGCIEGENITDLQGDGAIGKTGNADLRALQVAQNGHLGAEDQGGGTDLLAALAVVVATAVGKVEAEHIGPGADQGFDGALVRAGGAEGGNDFGALLHPEGPLRGGGGQVVHCTQVDCGKCAGQRGWATPLRAGRENRPAACRARR